jgi:hypothetical protein
MQLRLNDVAFTRYRIFRADTRILTTEESQHLRNNTPAPKPPPQ